MTRTAKVYHNMWNIGFTFTLPFISAIIGNFVYWFLQIQLGTLYFNSMEEV